MSMNQGGSSPPGAVDLPSAKLVPNPRFEMAAVYKALVEHVPDILILVGSDGTLLYISPMVTPMAGYDPEELTGKKFFDYLHPEDLSAGLQMLMDLLKSSGQILTRELRFRRHDGTWIAIEASSCNHLANPAISGITVSARDITDRAQLREERRTSEFLIERGLHDTISAVSATIDARDPYTAGHQRRVSELATRIGQELNLSAFQLRGLTLAASIHDLGKIKLSAEILTSPRRLTPIEYELIKTHAEAGYEILKDIHFPWPIAEIIRQHHEQIDGSGYPRGLKGEAILLEARIIAVADTVEAMASNRPYRAGLGIEAGLSEITRKRGTSYDAAAVDACLRLFKEKGYQLPDK